MIRYIFSISLITASYGMDEQFHQQQQKQTTLKDLLTEFHQNAQKLWGLRVPNDGSFQNILKKTREFLQKYAYPNIINLTNETYDNFYQEIDEIYNNIINMEPNEQNTHQATQDEENQLAHCFVALYTMSEPLHRRGILTLKKEEDPQKALRFKMAKWLYWSIFRAYTSHKSNWTIGFDSPEGFSGLITGKQILSLPWLEPNDLFPAACQFLTRQNTQKNQGKNPLDNISALENHIWKKKNAYYEKYGYVSTLFNNFFQSIDNHLENVYENNDTKQYWNDYSALKLHDPLIEVRIEVNKLFSTSSYAHLKNKTKDLSHLYRETTLREYASYSSFFRTGSIVGDYWNGLYEWRDAQSKQQQQKQQKQQQQQQHKSQIILIDDFENQDQEIKNHVLQDIATKNKDIFGNSRHGQLVQYVTHKYSGDALQDIHIKNSNNISTIWQGLHESLQYAQENMKLKIVLSLSIAFPHNSSVSQIIKKFLQLPNTVLFWAVDNSGNTFSDPICTNSTKMYIEEMTGTDGNRIELKDKIILVGNVDCAYHGVLVPAKDTNGALNIDNHPFSVSVKRAPISQTPGLDPQSQKMFIGASGQTIYKANKKAAKTITGSSFATPAVAGAVARAFNEFPQLTIQEVLGLLKASAEKKTYNLKANDIIDLLQAVQPTETIDTSVYGNGLFNMNKFFSFLNTIQQQEVQLQWSQEQKQGNLPIQLLESNYTQEMRTAQQRNIERNNKEKEALIATKETRALKEQKRQQLQKEIERQKQLDKAERKRQKEIKRAQEALETLRREEKEAEKLRQEEAKKKLERMEVFKKAGQTWNESATKRMNEKKRLARVAMAHDNMDILGTTALNSASEKLRQEEAKNIF